MAQQLLEDYKGSRLSENGDIRSIEITRTKEKEEMCTSIVDCLRNLVSEKCFNSKVNTGMGFFIGNSIISTNGHVNFLRNIIVDIECILDKKCTPVPIDTKPSPELKRVAILALQYQDMCKGTNEPVGLTILGMKLLESRGYRVLTIPYTEYRPRDKLVDRVKYLETKLKTVQ